MGYEYELYHHGTKGMKWGRRRYQNPDGSLTPLGRLRYGVGRAGKSVGNAVKTGVKNAVDKHKAKKAAEAEAKRFKDLMNKPVRELSEAELAERKARLEKERQVLDAEGNVSRLRNDPESFAKKFMATAISEVAKPALISAGKSALTKFLTGRFEKALGVDADDLTNSWKLLKEGTPLSELTDKQISAIKKRYENISEIKKGRNAEKEVDADTKSEFDRKKVEKEVAEAASKEGLSYKTVDRSADDESSATKEERVRTSKLKDEPEYSGPSTDETPKAFRKSDSGSTPKTEEKKSDSSPKTEEKKSGTVDTSATVSSSSKAVESGKKAASDTLYHPIMEIPKPTSERTDSKGNTILTFDDGREIIIPKK